MRHGHRRDYAALRRQMLGYGRGLGAYYTSMLVHRPDCGLELLRLSRQAVRDQFSRRGRRSSELGEDFPREPAARQSRRAACRVRSCMRAARLQARRMKRAEK